MYIGAEERLCLGQRGKGRDAGCSDARRNAIANRQGAAVMDQDPIACIFQSDIDPAAIQPARKAVSAVKPAIQCASIERNVWPVLIPNESSHMSDWEMASEKRQQLDQETTAL